MQKISKQNLIYAGVAVLLLVLIITYSSNNKKQAILPEVQEPVTEEIESGSQEPSQAESKVNPSDISVSDSTKKAFDDLLLAGSQAFLAQNYSEAISLYQKALAIKDSDVVYARLFTVYNLKGDKVKAIESIDKAISKFPSFTDYWITKLVYLDEKTQTSFTELKNIYNQGLSKVDNRTKVNLVTSFASIAEKNGMKDEAIATWQKAIELYPTNQSTYQAEIDRLKAN